MKFSSIALGLATAGSLVAAQPHRHHHRHADKRTPTDSAPGSSVTLYEMNGEIISKDQVDDCIAKKLCVWADGGVAPVVASSTVAAPSSTATTTSSLSPVKQQVASSSAASPPASSPASSTSASSSASASASPSASSSAASSSSSGSSSVSGGQGVTQAFPDGQLDCSHFPSDYGAVAVDWMNLGGWSGIQYISGSSISTAVSGDSCTEGAMCSYACPAGYQKSQWPTTQGSTGQSIGGISCSGGKLHLTNSALSSQLCIPGTGNVNVQNKLSTNVAICRTDYPGTESETVPLDTQGGSTNPLTCPDGDTYFKWLGKATSAQYYVNPSGVSASNGCTWGSSSNDWGNWAPVNLGVGTVNGATWISIMQNAPTNPNAKLDFNIEIVGDNLGGSCKYSNGQFTSATGSNNQGCTVQVMSGSATYVFS
ncbi:MAG: hypothetical protein M1827_004143 [Pycnora praestabilis]|nr:MAG: hypothetical protein M1827_004143 [Pycnora praestabilis]